MILAGLAIAAVLFVAYVIVGRRLPDLPPSDRPHMNGRALRRVPRLLEGA